MVTPLPALACEIDGPQVIVPPLPPVTLNVAPLAPVSEPAVAPHVPVTPLRFTPLVPAVELTLANVPVTAPEVRLSAVAPETFTELPMVSVPKFVVLVMPVVGPLTVTPASERFVDEPCMLMPVVPLLIVPPLTETVPVSLTSEMPVVAPVVLILLKATPVPPMVMPLSDRPFVAAPAVRFAVPLTLSVPPPE